MLGKVFFLVCVLTTFSQVSPSDLHRELYVAPSPQLPFKDAIRTIKNTDIRGEIVKMVFPKYEETFASLNELLLTKTNPEISEILDIFNYNFDAKLFVVRENSVQVDPGAYERVLSGKAMSVAKTLSPKNFIQQFMLYTVMESQILSTTKAIRPDIESKSVPVESMTAVIATRGHRIAVRDTASDPITSLISTIGSSACSSLVSTAYTQLNQTLNTAVAFLDTISVSSGNNVVVALITVAIDWVKEAVEGLREATEAITSSICSELFDSSTRKRRDVNALVDYGTRDIALGSVLSGIFDVLWSLLASVLNVTLKAAVDSLITTVETYLDSFLEGTVTSLLHSLIDSVFTITS